MSEAKRIVVPRVAEVTRDKDRERDEREWKRARAEWDEHKFRHLNMEKPFRVAEWRRRAANTRSF